MYIKALHRTSHLKPKETQKKKKKKKHPKKIPYISENGTLQFSARALKIKKLIPTKIYYTSRNGNFENKLLYFVKRKLFLYFRQRKPRKKSLYFRKRNFLIFRERYIQNPYISSTTSIFGTLVHSKPETYSKHCQTSKMKSFRFNIKKFLIFQETILYISGNGIFPIISSALA